MDLDRYGLRHIPFGIVFSSGPFWRDAFIDGFHRLAFWAGAFVGHYETLCHGKAVVVGVEVRGLGEACIEGCDFAEECLVLFWDWELVFHRSPVDDSVGEVRDEFTPP